MRRADRLFQIVQLLRARRLTTAADLAGALEVSTRTVYRDIQDLIESGVPIDGEAGVGYRLHKDFELKPLTFNVEELHALVLGARLVEAWADPELGFAVRSAMTKIEAVLPEPLQAAMLRTALFGPPMRVQHEADAQLPLLRRALGEDSWVRVSYVDRNGADTERVVVPLALYFWGPRWLLAAYCWLRGAYRSFRVDRIRSCTQVSPNAAQLSSLDAPICLAAYIQAMEQQHEAEMATAPRPLAPERPADLL
jgi:predicted DNA-binding transcriptional regulator YafY